jgi:two-component system, chemotaxis family, CheB/CheR fusion protein
MCDSEQSVSGLSATLDEKADTAPISDAAGLSNEIRRRQSMTKTRDPGDAKNIPAPPVEPPEISESSHATVGALEPAEPSSRPAPPSPSATTEDPNATGPPPERSAAKPFPIVGIGASAGGLAAFEAFFSAIPRDIQTGMAFVLVQHLAPDHKSILTELVKRYTRMQVQEVEDGMRVEPDCAYIIPPSHDMALFNGTLRLLEPTAPRGLRLPIDFFFRSLAQDQHERAVCVVLSGTGSDGTLGARAIKGEGGLVIAQSPKTAAYDGMPRSLIASGHADYVLPPAEMPAHLIAYAAQAFGKTTRPVAPSASSEDALTKICILLRDKTRHDFSQYKETTLRRRIERRMALHRIDRQGDYVGYLRQDPAEIEALFGDLLIGVTNFFRDPDAFAALEEEVIPRLFFGKPAGATVRVWVCGCSTGEEAYSIAILLREHLETLKQAYKVQVFATDIDPRAIEQARTGLYPSSISADVSAARLARFFSEDPQGGYRVQKVVRDLLVFSEQDLVQDPPFSRMDLISCRNLLIYLNGDLQARLIALFHYALNPNGVLFLGNSETVGEVPALFAPLDRKWKLYSRLERPRGAFVPTSVMREPPPASTGDQQPLPPAAAGSEQGQARSARADRAGPAASLCPGGHPRQRPRRDPPHLRSHRAVPGARPRRCRHEHLRDGARGLATRSDDRAAPRRDAPRAGPSQRAAGEDQRRLQPRRSDGAPGADALDGILLTDFYLIVLETATPEPTAPADDRAGPPMATGTGSRTPHRRAGARAAREGGIPAIHARRDGDLQRGAEIHQRGDAVGQRGDAIHQRGAGDLQGGAAVGQRGAGHRQRRAPDQGRRSLARQQRHEQPARRHGRGHPVRRPPTADHPLHADRDPADQADPERRRATGRRHRLQPGELHRSHRRRAGRAERSDAPRARGSDRQGAWYLMRIGPYRTLENVIEGAVITFVDISERKRSEDAVRAARAFAEAIVDAVREPLVVLDADLRVVSANRAFYRHFRLNEADTRDRQLFTLSHHRWDIPALRDRLQDIQAQGGSFDDFAVEQDFPDIGARSLRLNARRIDPGEGQPGMILLALEDVPPRGVT